jgi:hypothetical protein
MAAIYNVPMDTEPPKQVLAKKIIAYYSPSGGDATPPKQRSTTTERIAWAILIVSLLIGFGMTAFAPT